MMMLLRIIWLRKMMMVLVWYSRSLKRIAIIVWRRHDGCSWWWWWCCSSSIKLLLLLIVLCLLQLCVVQCLVVPKLIRVIGVPVRRIHELGSCSRWQWCSHPGIGWWSSTLVLTRTSCLSSTYIVNKRIEKDSTLLNKTKQNCRRVHCSFRSQKLVIQRY